MSCTHARISRAPAEGPKFIFKVHMGDMADIKILNV